MHPGIFGFSMSGKSNVGEADVWLYVQIMWSHLFVDPYFAVHKVSLYSAQQHTMKIEHGGLHHKKVFLMNIVSSWKEHSVWVLSAARFCVDKVNTKTTQPAGRGTRTVTHFLVAHSIQSPFHLHSAMSTRMSKLIKMKVMNPNSQDEQAAAVPPSPSQRPQHGWLHGVLWDWRMEVWRSLHVCTA